MVPFIKKHRFCLIFIFIALLAVTLFVLYLTFKDIASIWNSWGTHDGIYTAPTFWPYCLLVLFKLSLYIFPPLLIAIGSWIDDKKYKCRSYKYFALSVMSVWYLVLLTLKLTSDTIFELDRIFNFKLFNSIKDVETLAGFVVTFLLKKNYKIEPKVPEAKGS